MRAIHILVVVSLVSMFSCGEPFAATQATQGVGGSAGGGSAGSKVTGTGGAAGSSGSSDAGARAGGGGAGGGTADAGRIKNSGDCETASDCGGDPCVDIYPAGYRACVTKVPEAIVCSSPAGQCCKTADCAAAGKVGKCFLAPVQPSCGGAQQIPTNVCAADNCKTSDDCAGVNAMCVPAGVFGRKIASCFNGGCRRDTDCTAGLGGACLPIAGGCCPGPVGLFCVYKGGCTSNIDCPGGHCDTSTGKAVCVPGPVACPV